MKHLPTPYRTERIATDHLSFAQHMLKAFHGRTYLTAHERYIFEHELRLQQHPRPTYAASPVLDLAHTVETTPADVLRTLRSVSLICRWREYLGMDTLVPDRYRVKVVKVEPKPKLPVKLKWYKNPELIRGSVSR